MKKITRKKRGAAHMMVIGALIMVSVLSAYIIKLLQTDIYQISAYSLQLKASYLADEAASAAVSALLAGDEDSLLEKGNFTVPLEDEFEHKLNGETIGHSDIEMRKEQHHYYEDIKDWIVIRVNTSIDDTRASRKGEQFTYSVVVMVLMDNPVVQLYNIDPSSLDPA